MRFRDIQKRYQEAGGLEDDLPPDHRLTKSEKLSIRNQRIRDILFEMTLLILCIYLPERSKKLNIKCEEKVIMWLQFQSIFYGIQILKNIIIMIIIHNSTNARNIKRFIDLVHNIIVVNCQVAWFVYGNTFHYSLSNKRCKLQNDDMKGLWILMQVILSFGYIVFFSYAVVCLTFTIMTYMFVMSGGTYSRRR